jgi:hypothetical protein
MFVAVAVFVPRAKVVLVFEPGPPAATVLTVTLLPSEVPVIAALSAQSDVRVSEVVPDVLVDETSVLAALTLRVQVLTLLPQVPVLFIATDKFRAVNCLFVVVVPPDPIRT